MQTELQAELLLTRVFLEVQSERRQSVCSDLSVWIFLTYTCIKRTNHLEPSRKKWALDRNVSTVNVPVVNTKHLSEYRSFGFLDRRLSFIYSFCKRTVKILARLRGCAVSPGPLLFGYAVISILLWCGSIIYCLEWIYATTRYAYFGISCPFQKL